MIDHAVSEAVAAPRSPAAPAAPAAPAHPTRYQEALRRRGVETFAVANPGAGAAVRLWTQRVQARSWPPQAAR